MGEEKLKRNLVAYFRAKGFKVATEMGNFCRSADIVVLDNEDNIWIIECKVSDISRGLKQLETHKHSADRVYIATPLRKTRKLTLTKIREAGVGLIYVLPDGSVEIKETVGCEPWYPTRKKVLEKVSGS